MIIDELEHLAKYRCDLHDEVAATVFDNRMRVMRGLQPVEKTEAWQEGDYASYLGGPALVASIRDQIYQAGRLEVWCTLLAASVSWMFILVGRSLTPSRSLHRKIMRSAIAR